MKKDFRNDPIFVNALIRAYGRAEDYMFQETTNYIRLTNGMIHRFEKPRVETRFCFGHGQNGISTEEEEKAAHEACEAMNEKAGFIHANMEKYEHFDKYIESYEKDGSKIYAFCNRENGFCEFFNHDDMYYMHQYYWDKVDNAYELTKDEVILLKKIIIEEKTKFMKRLETYWKRFGNTKLRTWTYLVD